MGEDVTEARVPPHGHPIKDTENDGCHVCRVFHCHERTPLRVPMSHCSDGADDTGVHWAGCSRLSQDSQISDTETADVERRKNTATVPLQDTMSPSQLATTLKCRHRWRWRKRQIASRSAAWHQLTSTSIFTSHAYVALVHLLVLAILSNNGKFHKQPPLLHFGTLQCPHLF